MIGQSASLLVQQMHISASDIKEHILVCLSQSRNTQMYARIHPLTLVDHGPVVNQAVFGQLEGYWFQVSEKLNLELQYTNKFPA